MVILERLLFRWTQPVGPIYRRELRYGARSSWAMWGWVGYALPLSLLALLLVFGPLSVMALLVISLPLLGWVWRMQMALATSAAIVREVEGATWDLLRALPWSTARIINSKYAGVLVRMRRLFGPYLLVRGFAGAGMLAFAGTTLWFDWALLPPGTGPDLYWALLAMALGAAYMVVESALDLATDGALGMVASAFTRRQGQAAALALSLSALGLVAQLLATALLIGGAARITPGSGSPLQFQMGVGIDLLWWVALWGPGGALLFDVSPAACALLIPALILARFALLRALIALAARRAEGDRAAS